MIKNSIEIIKKIESYGYEAYIVGGMVRDYYMNSNSYDVDISTSATPRDLIKIFDNAKLPKEQYGAVTLYYKNLRYEITTFRRELKYENRRPIELEYTTDFYQDIERRDFTMNSLCMNSNEEIIDLYNGRKDIDKKIIKTIGDAEKKFKEDPLRMLRAVRFATVLKFKLDKSIISAIKSNVHLLSNISYYRKKQELNKIFACVNTKEGIKILCNLGMDRYLGFNNLNKIKVTSDILGIWSQLDVLDKYPFSKLEASTITSIEKILKNNRLSKYEIYEYGLYNATIAGEILKINKKSIIKQDKNLPIHSRKEINITVKEMCDILNKSSGEWIKDLYDDIEHKVVMSKIKNDNTKLKEYIIKNYR